MMDYAFRIAALIFALPLFVLSQSRSEKPHQTGSAPVAKVLRPVIQKIKNQAGAPIFLPSKLPTSVNVNDIHVVYGEGNPDGWKVSLYYKEGCGDACFVGYFEAKRGEVVSSDEVDKVTPLTNGIMGYYTARSCGVSCAPPQISWVYKGVLYTIQFRVNNKTKRQDEAEIIALANSAIQGAAR
jgi:hypothetical protein